MMKKEFSSLLLAFVLMLGFTPVFAAGNTQTVKDLQDAFTGESTAHAKYAAFAKKAKEEGYAKIALLFEAASRAEKIHAGNHQAALKQLGADVPVVNPEFDVKGTRDNLKDAIAGESYEVATMYPNFLKDASKEKVNIAMMSFNYAFQTEKKHKELYENALNSLDNNQVNSMPSLYQVCLVCGNTYAGQGPARCGICMTPNEKFVTLKL
ncbi:rubrerythrin family protein [Prolixibacter bellariivorans]|nr:rubrerythrin family protein [Prolixibacter bellariivorans]